MRTHRRPAASGKGKPLPPLIADAVRRRPTPPSALLQSGKGGNAFHPTVSQGDVAVTRPPVEPARVPARVPRSLRLRGGQGASPRWTGSGLRRLGRGRIQDGFTADSGGFGLDLAQFEQGLQGLGAFVQGPARSDRFKKRSTAVRDAAACPRPAVSLTRQRHQPFSTVNGDLHR